MLEQVQESVQPLVNAAILDFTGPAAAAQSLRTDFAPVVLPPIKPVAAIRPVKPPGIESDAIRFLSDLNCNMEVVVNNLESSPVIHSSDGFRYKPLLKIFKFIPRPLLRLQFGDRIQLHHSIIMQMDGLLFACFRLRLERDVCAASSATSFCTEFGVGISPASTFCGLFMPAPCLLGDVIQATKAERGYGIFVGPMSSNAWVLLLPPAHQHAKPDLLTFTFTGPHNTPWKGVLVSFAFTGKIKRKKPDTLFGLLPIWRKHVPKVVSSIPFCPARISSSPYIPVAKDDLTKRSPPLALAIGIPRPAINPVWNAASMRDLASLFPHSDVASMFLQGSSASGALLQFAGDRSKHVTAANGNLEPQMEAQIRERFVAEVALNRMMGPFSRCPFPNEWCMHQARVTPLDTRKKDKYDPLSQRFRVISNFSAGRAGSINSLIYSPKLISTHLQSSHLRDSLFLLGPNARFDAIDQHDAFRANHINLDDAHLYCYQVGREWFVDLRDPFGNVKSEYTYAIVVAVLKWAFECDTSLVVESSMLLGYVDNWFLLSKANCPSHDTRWVQLKAKFKLLGAPMHEEQRGKDGIVNALGWDWDLQSGFFACPEDKYANCLRLTQDWSRRAAINDSFLFSEIDSLAGLFQWISTACPAIIASVASLQALKHSLKRSGLPSSKLDVRSKGAVIDLAAFFITWDRKCCLFAGFSPTHRWEILIKVDASTDFGTGGVCFPSLDCFVHEWSPDERSRALAHSALPIRESTTFFELLGIFLILAHFAPMLRGRRVQIECDNEAAIRDLGTCFSGKPLCMAVIADIRNLCASSFIIPRYEHILSQYNLIADRLSHNDFLQAKVLCQEEFQQALLPPRRR